MLNNNGQHQGQERRFSYDGLTHGLLGQSPRERKSFSTEKEGMEQVPKTTLQPLTGHIFIFAHPVDELVLLTEHTRNGHVGNSKWQDHEYQRSSGD